MIEFIISIVTAVIIGFMIKQFLKKRTAARAGYDTKGPEGDFTKKAKEMIAQKKKKEK